jgi:hypothetical protein
MKRELNLARAADCLVNVSQTERTVIETRVRTAAGRGQCGCSNRGKPVVILVLCHVVDGNIEAGSVGDVENVKAELQVHALGDGGVFHKRDVHPPLPGLPEDIALSGGEIGS